MDLKTTRPNLGNENSEWAHCPHCSKMHEIVDPDGRVKTLPDFCVRCGCPMKSKTEARRFMDDRAKAERNESLARIGAQTRTVAQPEKVSA